jgi:hypothetical protein
VSVGYSEVGGSKQVVGGISYAAMSGGSLLWSSGAPKNELGANVGGCLVLCRQGSYNTWRAKTRNGPFSRQSVRNNGYWSVGFGSRGVWGGVYGQKVWTFK